MKKGRYEGRASALQMDAECSYETSDSAYNTAWCCNPQLNKNETFQEIVTLHPVCFKNKSSAFCLQRVFVYFLRIS
jgi:hypothetical protein